LPGQNAGRSSRRRERAAGGALSGGLQRAGILETNTPPIAATRLQELHGSIVHLTPPIKR